MSAGFTSTDTQPCVALVGGTELTRDVLTHVMAEAGFALQTKDRVALQTKERGALQPKERGAMQTKDQGALQSKEPGAAPESADDRTVTIVLAEADDTLNTVSERNLRQSVLIADIDPNQERIADLVLEGIDAVVAFDASAQELAEAVRTVCNGGSLLAPRPARRLVELARANRSGSSLLRTPLTPREIDILQCIGRGESVKETAASLGISAKTVENLQSRLFRKLDVRNRAQAFARAHSLGLLPS